MSKKIQLTKNGEDVYPITVPDSIAGLAQVAKTGSYNDLSDKPSIPLPSPPEVFIAEYGVTTLAEVMSAYNAGKFVALHNSGDVYVLCEVTNQDVTFCRACGPNVYCVYLDQEGFSGSSHPIPTALSELSDDSTHRLVTDTEKATWNGKYTKPAGGIPATDIADDVALLDESSSLLVPLEVERTENKVQSITGNESSTEKYPSIKAIADALGKMGVISQTQTWTQAADGGYDYTMSDPVRGLIPQANIDLFESAGAVFNEQTGYFEIKEIKDISYNEIARIYNVFAGIAALGIGRVELPNISPCRCSLGLRTTGTSISLGYHLTYSTLEQVSIGDAFQGVNASQTISFMGSAFNNTHYLRRITGIILLTATSAQTINNANSLEEITIKSLNVSLSIPGSPRLTAASVAYMITNAGTANINITLHATAYARATADPAVQAALQTKTNVTLASAW